MTERWPEIDEHIVQQHITQTMIILREELGYTIHKAIDAFAARYDQLRISRPNDFTSAACSPT